MKSSACPDLALLLRSSHPLVAFETDEDERATALLADCAEAEGLALFAWSAAQGLRRKGETQSIYGTTKLDACFDHIAISSAQRAVYQLDGALPLLGDPERLAKLLALAEPLRRVNSTLVLTGHSAGLPEYAQRRLARVQLAPPSDEELHLLVSSILSDVRKRMRVQMLLDERDVQKLLQHLRGLTLFEVRRLITEAIVRDGRLDQADLSYVLRGKRELVEKSGVLDYFPAAQPLAQIAGLDRLKQWLASRAVAFRDPSRAEAFGLSAPRGLLLLGVQGCGKSMCAKAVASAWQLPLLRLDPARLYDKYLGESEKNLRRALELAERLSPVVLWIDELEKLFGGTKSDDGGAALRILGAFLTWLQEKRASVFVVATCNDVTSLPPELLRKGRFDELFFVDLPDGDARAEVLRVHLAQRGHDPSSFQLAMLAECTEGFSGAELEQIVVAGLYGAFAEETTLSDRHLLQEIGLTQPLSRTMAEPIAALRAWARTRTVPAD